MAGRRSLRSDRECRRDRPRDGAAPEAVGFTVDRIGESGTRRGKARAAAFRRRRRYPDYADMAAEVRVTGEPTRPVSASASASPIRGARSGPRRSPTTLASTCRAGGPVQRHQPPEHLTVEMALHLLELTSSTRRARIKSSSTPAVVSLHVNPDGSVRHRDRRVPAWRKNAAQGTRRTSAPTHRTWCFHWGAARLAGRSLRDPRGASSFSAPRRRCLRTSGTRVCSSRAADHAGTTSTRLGARWPVRLHDGRPGTGHATPGDAPTLGRTSGRTTTRRTVVDL